MSHMSGRALQSSELDIGGRHRSIGHIQQAGLGPQDLADHAGPVASRASGQRRGVERVPAKSESHRIGWRAAAQGAPAGAAPSTGKRPLRCGVDRIHPSECWNQAIAKAEAVRGNAARLVSTPTRCLCKRRDRRSLAARMLLVRSSSELRLGADSCSRSGSMRHVVLLGLAQE
jgi:hypothetical protein